MRRLPGHPQGISRASRSWRVQAPPQRLARQQFHDEEIGRSGNVGVQEMDQARERPRSPARAWRWSSLTPVARPTSRRAAP